MYAEKADKNGKTKPRILIGRGFTWKKRMTQKSEGVVSPRVRWGKAKPPILHLPHPLPSRER